MRRSLGTIPGQMLKRHEKRMTTAIKSLTAVLARRIDAALVSQPGVMPTLELLDFRRGLAELILRHSVVSAEIAVRHIIAASGRKNNAIDLVMMGIRHRLRNHSLRQAELIEEYLRQRIGEHLQRGMTVAGARSAIRRILKTKGYAKRIALTETHTAMERGAWEAARSLGVRITKRWISRGDSSVRPDHASAHGQVKEIEQPFEVGGELLMYPGDPSVSAKQIVHCRCTVNYQIA